MSLSPISQKAHDISYAVFRCAGIMPNSKLAKELENAAVDFLSELEVINSELEVSAVGGVVDKLERLISLAESVGEMKTVNAMVLRRELGNLQTAIEFHLSTQAANRAAKASGKDNELDISTMFPASTLPDKLNESKKLSSPESVKSSMVIKKESVAAEVANNQSISSRQERIVRFIREIPFCRLRNILEMMPEVSERTVRNDIQSLIERQLVKRIGGGGPNSYFESLEVSLPTQTAISR